MPSADDDVSAPSARQAEPPPKRASGRLSSPHVWTTTTYFAEGFPYAVVTSLSDILFKEFGASLRTIGLTALLHVPWNLKFLWGPLLDAYGTKRAWLTATELALALVLGLLALVSTGANASLLGVFALVLLAIAFLSATHDIAVDGYYLESLDAHDQAKFSGYRPTAYRVGLIAITGPLVIAIQRLGWTLGFSIAATVMLLLFVHHARFLPRHETERAPIARLVRTSVRSRAFTLILAFVLAFVLAHRFMPSTAGDVIDFLARHAQVASAWIATALFFVLLAMLGMLDRVRRLIATKEGFYAKAFVSFLEQPKIGRILAFVILFRLGESFLMKMKYPFFRDIGMDMGDYGLASGTIGTIAGLVGPLVGGFAIARWGLRRWIWPFAIAQNLLHVLYVAVAHWAQVRGPSTPIGFGALTAVIAIEAFGAGLGTAVFMVYLMRCCSAEHRAAHMAILTALMSVGFTVAGVLSGFLAEAMGYTLYFAFTLVVAIPSLVLIAFLPNLGERRVAS